MHTRHYMYKVGRAPYTIDDAISMSEAFILRDYRLMTHMFHVRHDEYTILCLSFCHDENEWSLIAYTDRPSLYTRIL